VPNCRPPDGFELRAAPLWGSPIRSAPGMLRDCPAAQASPDPLSRILAGKARSIFPHASRASCQGPSTPFGPRARAPRGETACGLGTLALALRASASASGCPAFVAGQRVVSRRSS
jgi:hypothetical protein